MNNVERLKLAVTRAKEKLANSRGGFVEVREEDLRHMVDALDETFETEQRAQAMLRAMRQGH